MNLLKVIKNFLNFKVVFKIINIAEKENFKQELFTITKS